jgi:hypothetical protein
MDLTVSPHDTGQLITKIRIKWRFFTPTKDKSWQSRLLGRPAQPIRGTLAQRWGVYKYPLLLEGQVFNSFYSKPLILLYLFWLKHRSVCRYNPPIRWRSLLNVDDSQPWRNPPVQHTFWSQVRSLIFFVIK